MKIICVGMNYARHNQELNHSIGEIEGITVPAASDKPTDGQADKQTYDTLIGAHNPTIFLKPETALLRSDWPFYIPDFSNDVQYETELVVKINRLGKSIPERFAHRYYEEVTLGLDFTCRDLQRQLKAKGLPWEISKGFDNSAFCGEWIKLKDLGIVRPDEDGTPTEKTIQDLHFEMQLNGETRQSGYTGDMIHTVDKIISYVSRFYILKMGDLIFTGTPAGVGRLSEGDLITGQLEGRQVLECRIR
jgi:2-keto-4-pentenoate hydratase/2-oxohepta-3-ene-1,7-dioic acid hydratase in catechol pathway